MMTEVEHDLAIALARTLVAIKAVVAVDNMELKQFRIQYKTASNTLKRLSPDVYKEYLGGGL